MADGTPSREVIFVLSVKAADDSLRIMQEFGKAGERAQAGIATAAAQSGAAVSEAHATAAEAAIEGTRQAGQEIERIQTEGAAKATQLQNDAAEAATAAAPT